MVNNLINKLKSDKIFRTYFFFYISVIITIAFAIYNGVIGILNRSIWYGSFAIYLIILALQRIYTLINGAIIRIKYKNNEEKYLYKTYIIYIVNGFLLMILVIGLSFSIVQMVNSKKPFVPGEILAITNAAYAFYKITLAIINFRKEKKNNDWLIKTIRSVGLCDALVSILNLTTTLLTTFGGGEINKPMIISTGTGVSLLILLIGILMVTNGIKMYSNK